MLWINSILQLLTIFMIIAGLSVVLCYLGTITGNKMTNNKELLTPFECGFMPGNNARVSFSLRFFLIGLIFLLFDVELIMLFPMVMVFMFLPSFNMVISMTVFMFILILGLLYEFNGGSLSWSV